MTPTRSRPFEGVGIAGILPHRSRCGGQSQVSQKRAMIRCGGWHDPDLTDQQVARVEIIQPEQWCRGGKGRLGDAPVGAGTVDQRGAQQAVAGDLECVGCGSVSLQDHARVYCPDCSQEHAFCSACAGDALEALAA